MIFSPDSTEQTDLIGRMEQLKIEKTSIQKELTGNKKEATKISKELEVNAQWIIIQYVTTTMPDKTFSVFTTIRVTYSSRLW